ncbi:hypothetical protein BV20DRAFT_963998 [Pilatotrama ljubarskyi]|nr:hypothetical protein BV20DRAFT_963998 [Pilatotrama ljubarskyi]
MLKTYVEATMRDIGDDIDELQSGPLAMDAFLLAAWLVSATELVKTSSDEDPPATAPKLNARPRGV